MLQIEKSPVNAFVFAVFPELSVAQIKYGLERRIFGEDQSVVARFFSPEDL
jgi:hypothetical protein